MRRWRPPIGLPVILLPLSALLALAASLALASLLVQRAFAGAAEPVLGLELFGLGLSAVVLLAVAVVLALKAVRLLTLRFTVDRDGVVARWYGGRCVVPFAALALTEAEDLSLPEVKLGRAPDRNVVVLQTARARYLLAVADVDSFSREIAARHALGAVRSRPEGMELRFPALRAFAADTIVRRAWIVAAGLNLLLWAGLSWRYASLPDIIVTRFDPLGGPAGTRGRSYTILLLAASTAAVVTNGVLSFWLHRHSRTAAQLLLLAAALLQLLIAVTLGVILFGLT